MSGYLYILADRCTVPCVVEITNINKVQDAMWKLHFENCDLSTFQIKYSGSSFTLGLLAFYEEEK